MGRRRRTEIDLGLGIGAKRGTRRERAGSGASRSSWGSSTYRQGEGGAGVAEHGARDTAAGRHAVHCGDRGEVVLQITPGKI